MYNYIYTYACISMSISMSISIPILMSISISNHGYGYGYKKITTLTCQRSNVFCAVCSGRRQAHLPHNAGLPLHDASPSSSLRGPERGGGGGGGGGPMSRSVSRPPPSREGKLFRSWHFVHCSGQPVVNSATTTITITPQLTSCRCRLLV
ncbi:hypothetical protein LZ30DRAFT_458697 [Colletotrichum cereale]|nr:hypothetical protein LZ30DRAFT_458697 [Colletotrichum cereale]